MVRGVLLCCIFESQSNGFFLTSKHVSVLRAVSLISQCFENLFCNIYFKEKEKYTKGLRERFLRRNSLYNNEKCQRRRYLDNGQIIASCVQAKHRSEILSWPCFPCTEKIHTQLCPDSPRGPRCSEHAGQEFHLPWRG